MKWLRLAAWNVLSALGIGFAFAAALALGRTLGEAGIGRDLDPALMRGLFVLLVCFGAAAAFEVAGRITGYGRSGWKHWVFALILMIAMVGWWTGVEMFFRDLPISESVVFLITAAGMLGLAWVAERVARRLGITFASPKRPA